MLAFLAPFMKKKGIGFMLPDQEERFKYCLSLVPCECKTWVDGRKLTIAIRPKNVSDLVKVGEDKGYGDKEVFEAIVRWLNELPIRFIKFEHTLPKRK